MLDVAQIGAGLPLAASLAAAVTARGLQAGRRRTALNEALHELRRPLQALALAPVAGQAERRWVEGSLHLASVALERLEKEINGEPPTTARAPVAAEPLLGAATERWRARAALAGAGLELRWRAGNAVVEGDRCALAQALDNLIVNAIEHGGPPVVVEARICRGRLCVSVTDSGPGRRSGSRRDGAAELLARLRGRTRRGHGLRVVRRTVAAHRGEFRLHCSERRTEAALELPLIGLAGGDDG